MAPLTQTNTDTKKLLQYLPQYGNYNFSSMLGAAGSALSGGVASYNDIAWFAQAVQGNITGNEDLNNTISAGANLFVNIFTNMSTNDVAQDSKKNNNDDKKIDDNKDKANEIFSSVNESLNTIFSACETKQADIESALKEIEKLGGNKGLITKKQEELQEKIVKIKEQQKVLNNPDSEPKDRRDAIKTILLLVSDINALAAEVDGYKTEIEAQQGNVKEASEEVENLSKDMEKVVSDGTIDTEQLTQENIQLMANGTQKVAESIQKKAFGTEQIAVGTAMESGPQALVTGSEGAQLIASGTSKIAGGVELMTGAMSDFARINDLASNIQQSFQHFSSFANGIGEYNNGIQDLVGAFNTTVEPMITSIGTWSAVKDANKALGQYTTEYAQAIGMNEVNNDGTIDESKEDENKEVAFKKYEFDMAAFDNALKIKEV